MKKIIPSLIAKNQKELDERVEKVNNEFKTFQLDIMDGKFVENKSLWFDFKVPAINSYEADLMINNPKRWIEKNWKKADTIIFQIESMKREKTIDETINLIRSKKRKVGIAINPGTRIERIFPYINQVDMILVRTVKPGKYGSRFKKGMLKKVKTIRKASRRVNIEVDGGLKEKTIKKAAKAGADNFVVGSYLQKSKNVKTAKKELEKIIKKS